MKLRVVSWGLYLVVGVFFGLAAQVKLVDPEAFLSSMLTYELFPYKVAAGLALFAPVLEALLAICLVTGVLRKGASFLTAAMLLVFIVLVLQGLLRGLEMDCGCFGSNTLSSVSDYLLKIGQNLLLLGAVLLARFLESKSKAQPS
ncbi:MauE/DoxX family redox-associated membrane protein [Pelagicoccus mobilis]|uniref:Methylamine utilisation protein MauE domain-containing protein n=1 Tax=Pelagicoccus mobilis TaxID=415221 RepID=A0A934S358_9BACT|nr:MauE/DoxX family redox-associated membrane protein [Pelagicoccus mobilis]MBK1878193.1 hypothetical protein [Pelagicoccus mobilis]